MRILFLCGRNRRRSPTAEAVVGAWPGFEVESAGVQPDADSVVTAEQIAWAELIVVMEKKYLRPLKSRFQRELRDKRVASLDIADDFELMEPRLMELIEQRMARVVRR